MPVTFGAVGDIISVCLLVKDLVDALDKTRGSKAEYQSLIRELWILDRSLLEIDLLARTHGGGGTPELEALCNTATKAVNRCRELVTDFSKRVKKYQNSLGENETPTFLKATAMKVRWSIGEKDAVDKFRAEVAATSASLQMLLATASVKLMDIHGKSMKIHMATIKQQNEQNLSKQDAMLLTINDRLESTNRLINSGNAVTTKIAEALRLDWLRQLGSELKGYMRRIIAMNIATYHAVISIQSSLPGRLERGLIEEPFILEDAIGRIAPVHLQFVTSWDAFNAVLELRFREMQGFQKIKKKQYGLQEKASKREIEQSRPWQRAFLPGQRIEMSFIFDAQDPESGVDNVSCPGCQTTSINPTDAEIQCENCRMWFRRITVVHDVKPPPQVPVPSPWRSRAEFGKPGLSAMVSGPVRPGKKRVAPADLDGEDDVREFKRVRLVTRKERPKLQAFGRVTGDQIFKTFSALSEAKPEPSTKTQSLYRSKQLHSSQEQGFEILEELQSPNLAASDKHVDLTEIVAEELRKAREAGLLSKAVPGGILGHDDYTELYGRGFSIENVTTGQDIFGNPKWSAQETLNASTKNPRKLHSATNPNKRAQRDPLRKENLMTKKNLLRSQIGSLASPPTIEVEDIVATGLVNNAPILMSHPRHLPQQVFSLDPIRITLEGLRKAKEYLDLPKWNSFEQRYHDSLWPFKSLTIFVSSGLIIGLDEVDCRLITHAAAKHGTPFRLPYTSDVFYGASIGRWILDWTCHLSIANELMVQAALQLWNHIHTIEKAMALRERRTKQLWGVSTEADMSFHHLIVCYSCFTGHLLRSMDVLRMPDGREVKGDTFPTLEDYIRAFLDSFFILTPSDVSSPYQEALRMLGLCASYCEAGLDFLAES